MKKASKLLFIFGGAFCIYSVISIIASFCMLMIGGFVPGLVLLIVSLAESEMWMFLEIGLPIMGGLWIGAFAVLPMALLPFIGAILSFIASRKKAKKGIAIVTMILAVLMLLSGSMLEGLLILLGSIFLLSSLSEEKAPATVIELK